ncbi:MAG: ribulose-phosphate 3-epimerase [Gemmatimonadetes bacterium]|jgi:ribulose-phosphate 3-epimerase|nr:ribulose-phosphate 3-epimerase [Gemmatimonadota bacterium]MEE2879950.1 ribulose-phosphate 3-epimerase [Gemmatimonadota bacterium]|tara:strand:+ start:3870 stop:4541 length:672 start_codon:yes stop_codon:yes gene_type:complete
MVKIAPSILSSDFGRLAEQVIEAEEAGADWIHVDVMDGSFVPNITIGPAVTEAVRSATDLPVDVHLMINNPDQHLEAFADAGADYLTVHQEACVHLHKTIDAIRDMNVRPGITLNPATSIGTIEDIIDYVDLVLVMSVNPGFGGQSFIPSSIERIKKLKDLIRRRGLTGVELEVDGGINENTAASVVNAGSSVLVAGSAVYGHPEGVAEAIRRLRLAASEETA